MYMYLYIWVNGMFYLCLINLSSMSLRRSIFKDYKKSWFVYWRLFYQSDQHACMNFFILTVFLIWPNIHGCCNICLGEGLSLGSFFRL